LGVGENALFSTLFSVFPRVLNIMHVGTNEVCLLHLVTLVHF